MTLLAHNARRRSGTTLCLASPPGTVQVVFCMSLMDRWMMRCPPLPTVADTGRLRSSDSRAKLINLLHRAGVPFDERDLD